MENCHRDGNGCQPQCQELETRVSDFYPRNRAQNYPTMVEVPLKRTIRRNMPVEPKVKANFDIKNPTLPGIVCLLELKKKSLCVRGHLFPALYFPFPNFYLDYLFLTYIQIMLTKPEGNGAF